MTASQPPAVSATATFAPPDPALPPVPAQPPRALSALRVLLLTDVVDSTALSQALGDERMAALWQQHDRIARDLLPLHHGREIDKTDGMLLLFDEVADALAYAAAYHAGLAALPHPLAARAGLHRGAVLLRENTAADVARGAKPLEVEGLAKPMAARVMALARGGQTLLSADAAQALGHQAAALLSHGHWRLKGVAEPLELFDAATPPHPAPPDGDKGWRVVRQGTRWLPLRQVPNNLPQHTTSFHGRERELDEIKAVLQSARLVTLLGMGGLGKTRLSMQVAAELLAEFPDGVWFLDLSPLRDEALVVEEAARLLQVQHEPGRSLLQALGAALVDKQLLLIVDNCEHLVQAAATLVQALLRAAPALRVMASSRVALHVPGERCYGVPPLAVPGSRSAPAGRSGGAPDLAALQRLPAVALFVERARGHRSGFVLDASQADAVAELVTRLEGIPLALELAAARVRSLSVADINTRLKDRYRLLTGGSPVLQQRQQTLRALVDWSYGLLSAAEQTLLQRLGVFSGGFDLAAAEAVCGTDPLSDLDVLDLLDRLVEHSLVMLDATADTTRYTMLETLREYALERLAAAPGAQTQATRARHAAHFFERAKQARDGLQGADQPQWVQRVEADLDNLRAAMAAAREGSADPLLAAKLPVALQGFWVLRGYLAEGRAHIDAALALPAVQALDIARAHTLYVAAVMADAQGEPGAAVALLETCLGLRRAAQDLPGIATTLSTLAMARLASGDAAAALDAEGEALALFRQIGHRVGEAIGLQHLGHIHMTLQSWPAAEDSLRQGLVLAQALAHLEVECECELLLGECALARGEPVAARQQLLRALLRSRDTGDRRDEAKAQAALGRLALQQGDRAAAQPLLADALRAFQRFEMRAEMIEGLEDHARLADALGHHEPAACWLAGATQARRLLGLPRAPLQQQRADGLRGRLQQQLGDWGWSVAEAAGSTAALGDAVQSALQLDQLLAAARAAALHGASA